MAEVIVAQERRIRKTGCGVRVLAYREGKRKTARPKGGNHVRFNPTGYPDRSHPAPLSPYLLKGGKLAAKKAFEKLGEQFSEAAWEQAKDYWEKLRRKKKVTQVAETAAAPPENAALRIALAEEVTMSERRQVLARK